MHTMLNLHCSTLFPNIYDTHSFPHSKPNSHLSPKDFKSISQHKTLFFFYKGFLTLFEHLLAHTNFASPVSLLFLFFFFYVWGPRLFTNWARSFSTYPIKTSQLSTRVHSFPSTFSYSQIKLYNTHPHLWLDNDVPNLARMKIKHCRSRYSQHYAHVRLSEKDLTHQSMKA